MVHATRAQGETAATNESTFSYRLAALLKNAYPGTTIEVINAGISGYRLADQQQMLSSIVLPMQPDVVLIYPGFNDFADYCSTNGGSGTDAVTAKARPLFTLPRPAWSLTVAAIGRQTPFLWPEPLSFPTVWTEPK